ncbi:nitrite reductase (NAD(P)H) small subunit [Vibrio vulnificus]|uniref:Nitrite reductase (NAD(P)H) small subunit n=1 Tax=Vibrio vulnificus TaxID=672 RepID=A0ABX4X2Z5_VIBVL|nr:MULTISPECIES: nitrite reductase small subunit NirD [Vibrio]AUL98031.1 Nitrite reductase small subunit [Vibrio vulnificus]AVX01185.1 nitrite reductase small subunit [Vibrio vulnificus Env1]EGQ7692143.1 nitrite reductase small subunit NirD [Vibrio vulnificus]EGQ7756314.1 nitrite reductase small subunit NirD [Vibrio vulnificus]EGQ7831085.1 nitrite reductase small subunit NirD [Vibrio vulnificus]
MQSKQFICHLNELKSDHGHPVLLNDEQLAMFYVPKEGVFAIQNWDPIGKAFVLSRGIVGDIQGALCVASPLYKQHFCLKTGKCFEDESVKLTTWPVLVENDAVYVLG